MRISSSTIMDVNVATLNQQQTKMFQTQQQIASGRRILTPADDPAAAAQVLNVSQAEATNTQYSSNIGGAQTALSLSEGVLQSVTTLLQNIQATAVQAGNPVLANSDRKSMASALQGQLDELLVYANSTDATGNYLYSGFQGNTPPFAQSATGVQYMGDDGQRSVQVNASRQIATSNSGADIFMRIKNGNGTFVTALDPSSNGGAGNAGSATISQGDVIDPTQLTGNGYQIAFHVSGGVTTYDVLNTTTNTAVSTGNAYSSGQAITFDGMRLAVSGAPANGDQFTVKPSTNESIFTTISNLINTLNTPLIAGNVAGATKFASSISDATNGLSRGLDNVLTVRASIGARLNALDSESTLTSSLDLQYKQTLSQLQDVDYNKAITDLTQQQTMLQAAQKSFLQVANLSMFNYMP
ncbi:MAG: flagellar hook-associated protein FlgL [Nitrosomonadales bacterium]|nr:flagellar hook-associated protein FlgL [Nitrosomonadales bacterium]